MSQLIIQILQFHLLSNIINAICSLFLIGSQILRCCPLIGRGWGGGAVQGFLNSQMVEINVLVIMKNVVFQTINYSLAHTLRTSK